AVNQFESIKISPVPHLNFIAKVGNHDPFKCRLLKFIKPVEDRSHVADQMLERFGQPYYVVHDDIRRRQSSCEANTNEKVFELQTSGSKRSVSQEYKDEI